MSLPKMSTLVPGVETPSATRVMLLWATVWLFPRQATGHVGIQGGQRNDPFSSIPSPSKLSPAGSSSPTIVLSAIYQPSPLR